VTRVLGLDIGGSTSRARLVVDGVVVAEAAATGAALTSAGRSGAADALDNLIGQLPALDAPLDAACAGSAGVRTERATCEFLSRRLAPLTSSGRVVVVDDASLVLPAAGLAQGIAVICGTGSMAVGSVSGREHRAGGWGYLLGDEGSGYWIVRAAIRTLLTRRARGEPLGALGTCLLAAAAAADLDDLRAAFYRQPRPRTWACHVPAIMSSDDPAVTRITADAAAALAGLAAEVAERLAAPDDLPVVLAGGLMAGARMKSATTAAIAAALPANPVLVLREPPVAGAVRLAEVAARRR
jgi:glucosamine kinase